jgi:hypothetical protein
VRKKKRRGPGGKPGPPPNIPDATSVPPKRSKDINDLTPDVLEMACRSVRDAGDAVTSEASTTWKCGGCGYLLDLFFRPSTPPGHCDSPMSQIDGPDLHFSPLQPLQSNGQRSLLVTSKGVGPGGDRSLHGNPESDKMTRTEYRQLEARRTFLNDYRQRHPTTTIDTALTRYEETLVRDCVECGDQFTPAVKSRAKFCSDKCRARHGRRKSGKR